MEQKVDYTYQLEPKDEERYQIRIRFYPQKVNAIIKSIFDERMANEQFDANNAPNLVEELTKIIRLRVKTELNMPRYKLAIQVVLGSLAGHAIKVVSKCLWDPNYDNYASVSYNNETLYCVGMVFGCYHE